MPHPAVQADVRVAPIRTCRQIADEMARSGTPISVAMVEWTLREAHRKLRKKLAEWRDYGPE